MDTAYEHVLRVDDYYDGLRAGIALYHGMPHHFRTYGCQVGELDPDEERFELRPVADPSAAPIVVRAQFRNSLTAPDPQCPPLRPQEVLWTPV